MPDTEPTQPIRIVVAEDETIIRLDIVETLTAQGYEVVGEAENGQRAIELVEDLKPDVVLMDISMPVMDGLSATRYIAQHSIAPVVILTAFSQRDLIDQATQAGAMSYIVKPFSETDLVPAIELAKARFDQLVTLESEISDLTVGLRLANWWIRPKHYCSKNWILPNLKHFGGSKKLRWIVV